MTRKRPWSPLLPQLTSESRAEPSQARQDRILAEIGDWIIDGPQERVQRFYSAVGQPDLVNPQSRLLAIAGRQHTSRPEILIRRGLPNAQSNDGPPLLSGKIVTASHVEGANSSPSRIGRRLYFQGTLNPTRFVVHQPKLMRGRSIIDPAHGELPEVRVFARPRVSEPGDEVALDGRDNVILTQRGLSYARPDAWQRHLNRYFEEVPRALDAELREYAEDAGVRIEFRPRSRIEVVETYWEFEVPDPTAFVRRIASAITALGRRSLTRTYEAAQGRMDVDGNLVSVRTDFQTGGTLKVYAKTHRRIRFEVEHSGEYFQRVPRNFSRLQREAPNWIPLLAYLAEQAAPIVNAALRRIGQDATSTHEHRDPFELAACLVQILGSAEEARKFASILANDGRIVVGPRLVPREKARALLIAGVLERVQIGRGVYSITPEYASALRHLHAFSPSTQTQQPRPRQRRP